MSWRDHFHYLQEYATKYGYDDITITYDLQNNEWMTKLIDDNGNVILTGSGPNIKTAVDDLYDMIDDPNQGEENGENEY